MRLPSILKRLLRCQRGASAMEYAFLCCLIVVVMVAGLKGFAGSATTTWNNVSTQVQNAVSQSAP
ncbi:Flp family type IVb pilin [Novosphingobium sp. FSY-8]|uniref:Flp family type IVb pilin n=1 Tax=Novosphingobium ovatum TaxID=1908523 RepID=A0ABW9XBE1_9SPHN|nr:Flp family type IVb pilin [Novosphingobium ovatum]NBC35805.1 Flp family type IVb pilin [Novosphingobium ovatum]